MAARVPFSRKDTVEPINAVYYVIATNAPAEEPNQISQQAAYVAWRCLLDALRREDDPCAADLTDEAQQAALLARVALATRPGQRGG